MSYSTCLALIQSLGRSIGLSASLILLFGYVHRAGRLPRLVKGGLIGALFGFCAILAMTSPVVFQAGVILDGRGIMLALAAPFGGYAGVIVAALIASVFRFTLGGAVAAGIAAIATAGLLGILFKFIIDRQKRPMRVGDFAVLGSMICTTLFAIFLLPEEDIHRRILTVLPIFVMTHVLGTIALGSLLLNQKHIISSERQLRSQADTDALTGLPNRRAFDRVLSEADVKSKVDGSVLCLLLVDMDGLKTINDKNGHSAGDEAIRTVSQAIRASIRSSDFPARIGGDEFAIILRECNATTEDVVRKRLRLKLNAASLMLPFGPISVSVGAATSGPELSLVDLLRQADNNLYTAKSIEQRYGQVASSDIALA